ncbi:MAG TPA: hypothetical protein VFD92_20835 [Candidatus Binatia bacterium]|nr:hypothetical protein [Candidatus Binatia bacterium]
MAKARARAKEPTKRRSAADIERMIWLERARGPILPSVLAGVALLVWVLANAGVIPMAAGVAAVGALVLALCLFAAVRDFIADETTSTQVLVILLFAILFAAATSLPLFRTLYPRPAIAAGDLATKGAAIDVVTGDASGPYRVIVEGHLPESREHATQTAHYRLRVEGAAPSPTFLDGDFSDRWGMRRLGRRGSAPVHVVRSTGQHELDASAGSTFKISLDELSPPNTGSVSVSVHPDAFPTVLIAGLGVLLTGTAMVLDAWRTSDSGDGLTTLVALGALFGVVALRRFAPPHPGFGDLIFNGVVGGVAGLGVGWLLWKIGGPALRSRLAGDGR